MDGDGRFRTSSSQHRMGGSRRNKDRSLASPSESKRTFNGYSSDDEEGDGKTTGNKGFLSPLKTGRCDYSFVIIHETGSLKIDCNIPSLFLLWEVAMIEGAFTECLFYTHLDCHFSASMGIKFIFVSFLKFMNILEIRFCLLHS